MEPDKDRHADGASGAGIEDDKGHEGKRKPYQKPAFVWERAFETMALSCGKVNMTQQQCKLNRKNS